MSHVCGTVEILSTPVQVGPDSGDPPASPGTWTVELPYEAAGTKFVILHFEAVSLPAGNRLEVELGYDTDVFTSADGTAFWTRPVNIHHLPGGTIPLRYVAAGSNSGGATVDRYGRGQSVPSYASGHDSVTNCDPFLPGPWVEPDFPHVPGSTGPRYDPFWICDQANPPEWVNARCAAAGSVRRDLAPSVGMILTVHPPASGHPEESVSTCSVTLIDSDLVATAAHCIADHPFEVPSSSVTFDYEVNCDGSLVPAYDAVFHKVIRLVKYRYTDGRDYAILQLRGAPPVAPVPVLNGYPGAGSPVFGIHHPNGAVKKISPSPAGTVPVQNVSGGMIHVDLDVSGGSSGSGLFDTAGRLLGVLSVGNACDLYYSSSALMLNDPIEIPDPPEERAVMLVLDRSGSMSEPALGGGSKIDAARDAAELFTSMMRAAEGNAAGLVSFAGNASSPPEAALDPLDEAQRGLILGALPGIAPGGRTSIGDGLASARSQLNATSGLPRAMLVLTDGMENEPQAIADVTGLGGTEITAIGFGTESSLDGPRLTALAQDHGGYYKRAGTGLELRKFFALAFGDIFEAGALSDPDLHLARDRREGPAIPFSVCGEETVTVVAGWDMPQARLRLVVTTPSGQVLDLSAGGIVTETGNTWTFARIPLPQGGERDGTWTARVVRSGGSQEFPPEPVALDYFVTVIARGGPSLRPFRQPRHLYTGDVLTPRVIFQYPDESVPRGGEVRLRIRRPDAGTGTALADGWRSCARRRTCAWPSTSTRRVSSETGRPGPLRRRPAGWSLRSRCRPDPGCAPGQGRPGMAGGGGGIRRPPQSLAIGGVAGLAGAADLAERRTQIRLRLDAFGGSRGRHFEIGGFGREIVVLRPDHRLRLGGRIIRLGLEQGRDLCRLGGDGGGGLLRGGGIEGRVALGHLAQELGVLADRLHRLGALHHMRLGGLGGLDGGGHGDQGGSCNQRTDHVNFLHLGTAMPRA
nr:trypsin-like peptidase domain-containing protein [Mangrovicoccus ximenensis]